MFILAASNVSLAVTAVDVPASSADVPAASNCVGVEPLAASVLLLRCDVITWWWGVGLRWNFGVGLSALGSQDWVLSGLGMLVVRHLPKPWALAGD